MNDDGGPAFPCAPTDSVLGSFGMSLRDYFAAHAPAYPFPTSLLPDDDGYPVDVFVKRDAAWRYMYADAMLAERAKVTP